MEVFNTFYIVSLCTTDVRMRERQLFRSQSGILYLGFRCTYAHMRARATLKAGNGPGVRLGDLSQCSGTVYSISLSPVGYKVSLALQVHAVPVVQHCQNT